VAQKFSLYGQLTVGENLDFFARAYGLGGDKKRERIAWALSEFKLEPFVQLPSAQLPGGFKQRLAMAAALLHRPRFCSSMSRPAVPTPLPAANSGSASRRSPPPGDGDRDHSFHARGRVLRSGRDPRQWQVAGASTPAELRAHASGESATIEDAFVAIVQQARGKQHEGALV